LAEGRWPRPLAEGRWPRPLAEAAGRRQKESPTFVGLVGAGLLAELDTGAQGYPLVG